MPLRAIRPSRPKLAQPGIGATDHRRTDDGRMGLQCRGRRRGRTLKPPPDDGLIGAAENPQEAVVVDAGQVGGSHPVGSRTRLSGFDLSRPGWSGSPGRPWPDTTRSCAPRLARPTLPRLADQYRRWSASVHPATPPPNSVAAQEVSTGMPNFSVNVGVIGGQRRRAGGDDRMPARSSGPRSECRTVRSAAGTSDTALGPMPAHRVGPRPQFERGSRTNGRASATHCSTR